MTYQELKPQEQEVIDYAEIYRQDYMDALDEINKLKEEIKRLKEENKNLKESLDNSKK